MLMDIRDYVDSVLRQVPKTAYDALTGKMLGDLGNAASNNFIYNSQTKRPLPASPYWALNDASRIQDPKLREQAINDASMNMVIGMTTPLEPKPTANGIRDLVTVARDSQRDEVVSMAQKALDRIHQSPTGVRDYAPVDDFLRAVEKGKDTPDQMRAVQELLALHGETNLSTKLPKQLPKELEGFDTKSVQKAIKVHGTTDVPESASFVTRDGKIIDSSGKRQGSLSEGRNVDHREIAQDALAGVNKYPNGMSGSDALSNFMNDAGVVRVNVTPDEIAIDTLKPLSKQQLNQLNKLSQGRKIEADISNLNGTVANSGTFKSFADYERWATNFYNQAKGVQNKGGAK